MIVLDIVTPLIPIALAIWACVAMLRVPPEERTYADENWFDRHKR